VLDDPGEERILRVVYAGKDMNGRESEGVRGEDGVLGM
jgi:hypothetical protein